MGDSLCRLTVAHAGVDGSHAVDLALPSRTCLGQLMPSILDIVGRAAPAAGCIWRLSRIGEPPLDELLTLEDNAIRDGDLLLLTAVDTPAPEWVVYDASQAVAQVDNATGGLPQLLPAVCCVFIGGIVAAVLIWTATGNATTGNLVTGAGLAAAAGLGAAVLWRTHADPLMCVPLGLVAVIFAAAVGFIAVPAGPLAAHALLASAAALCLAVVMLRLTGCGTTCLTSVVAITLLTTAVAAAGVTWQLPAHAAGACLATLALAMLGVAPRLALASTGIGPSTPNLDDLDEPPAVTPSRAVLAHRVLTGLVAGASATAALGAATVAAGSLRGTGSSLLAATFSAIIGLALLLRSRTHVDAIRRSALVVSAMMSATASFVLGVVSVPESAHWFGAVAAAAGAAALCGRAGLAVGPLVRRAVDLVEYPVLAAVVPMACWVGGLYGVVREVGLL